jgi:hypothetical protein
MLTFIAPKEVSDMRKKVCMRCPYYHEVAGACTVCKCLVALKTKLSEASCPTGRWQRFKGE